MRISVMELAELCATARRDALEDAEACAATIADGYPDNEDFGRVRAVAKTIARSIHALKKVGV